MNEATTVSGLIIGLIIAILTCALISLILVVVTARFLETKYYSPAQKEVANRIAAQLDECRTLVRRIDDRLTRQAQQQSARRALRNQQNKLADQVNLTLPRRKRCRSEDLDAVFPKLNLGGDNETDKESPAMPPPMRLLDRRESKIMKRSCSLDNNLC
ncbi:Oidioi.mRNA.OKI2018_I69.chr1.g981.t1.cds [Oikopleura dioica]|uniref:Oidioi.mRNA.OKI2018_I69.PAR.g12803.t1.cds n=1 Tax=Oikopleura dioica TaxID=34765 RepID=A0ABN7SQV4_OIKDI|nr:Oidioi.mRNA.OKI2018_I69.PAR.g12803.t1.cds [Oikopleura dioica]CAG5103878.1 Oidioi.mRNA.OKI2018_I69.chr1.g981.t1.cds [Oikopleura dioica]